MKKLFLLAIIVMVPFFADAQKDKKQRKTKQPALPAQGNNPNWANQATGLGFKDKLVIHTVHGTDTIASKGDDDVCILWRDGQGDITSYFVIGGAGKDTCTSISGSMGDTLWVTGGYSDTAYFGDSTAVCCSFGGMDVYLACITKTGKLVWVQSSGTDGDDIGTYVYPNRRDRQIIARGLYRPGDDGVIRFGGLAVTTSKVGVDTREPAYQWSSGVLSEKSVLSRD